MQKTIENEFQGIKKFTKLSDKETKNKFFSFLNFRELLIIQAVSKEFCKLINSFFHSSFLIIFKSESLPLINRIKEALVYYESKNPLKFYNLIHWSLEYNYCGDIEGFMNLLYYKIIYKEIILNKPNKLVFYNKRRSAYEQNVKFSNELFLKKTLLNQQNKASVISQIINIRFPLKSNRSIFWMACSYSREQAFFYFLRFMPNVNSFDDSESTCLLMSLKTQNLLISKHLLILKSEYNKANLNGETPLCLACETRQFEIANIIIDGLCKNENYTFGIQECKAFSILVKYKNIILINKMLKRKINLNNNFYKNKNPLLIACELNHYDLINLLISNGSDVNLCSPEYPYSPLLSLIKKTNVNNQRNDKIIEFLLEHKANSLLPTLEKSPIIQAILLNDIALISLIAKYSIFEKDTYKKVTSILSNTPFNILEILKKIPVSQIEEKIPEKKEKNEPEISYKLKSMSNKICNYPLKTLKRIEYPKKSKRSFYPFKYLDDKKFKKTKKKKKIIAKNNKIPKSKIEFQLDPNLNNIESTLDSKLIYKENKNQKGLLNKIEVMNVNYKTLDLKPFLEDRKDLSRNLNFDSAIKINNTITKNNITNDDNLRTNNINSSENKLKSKDLGESNFNLNTQRMSTDLQTTEKLYPLNSLAPTLKEEKSLRPFSASNLKDNINQNPLQLNRLNNDIDSAQINTTRKILNSKRKLNFHSKSTVYLKKSEKKNKEVKKLNIISILPFGIPQKKLAVMNSSNTYMYNRIINSNMEKLKKVLLQQLL